MKRRTFLKSFAAAVGAIAVFGVHRLEAGQKTIRVNRPQPYVASSGPTPDAIGKMALDVYREALLREARPNRQAFLSMMGIEP